MDVSAAGPGEGCSALAPTENRDMMHLSDAESVFSCGEQ